MKVDDGLHIVPDNYLRFAFFSQNREYRHQAVRSPPPVMPMPIATKTPVCWLIRPHLYRCSYGHAVQYERPWENHFLLSRFSAIWKDETHTDAVYGYEQFFGRPSSPPEDPSKELILTGHADWFCFPKHRALTDLRKDLFARLLCRTELEFPIEAPA